MKRGLRVACARLAVGFLLVAAAATAGCSILLGVSGDPVVVDDDGGDAEVEAAAESGEQPDTAMPQDAASADEPDAGDAGDGPVE